MNTINLPNLYDNANISQPIILGDKTYMFNDNEYIFDDEDGFSHTDSDKFILIR